MENFTIKTYTGKQASSFPTFYILNKGNNSGRPMKTPCRNCFEVTTKTETDFDFYFWLTFGLWRSKSFRKYLIGSVIPFIRIKEMKNHIELGAQQAKTNIGKFNKDILLMKQLEKQEETMKKTLKLIEQARTSVFQKYGLP